MLTSIALATAIQVATATTWVRIASVRGGAYTYELGAETLEVTETDVGRLGVATVRVRERDTPTITFVRVGVSENACRTGVGKVYMLILPGDNDTPTVYPYIRGGGTVATGIADTMCQVSFPEANLAPAGRL